MKKSFLAIYLISQFLLPAQAIAGKDVKGSTDHPLISRYPDFFIKYYAQHEYDEAEILTGPFDTKKRIAATKTIEGKVTNIKYQNKSKNMNTTTLQLYKNYEKALKKLNSKFLLACRGTKCFTDKSTDFGIYIGNWYNTRPLIYKGFNSSFGREVGILSAVIPNKKGGDIYAMITIGADIRNKKRTILMSFIEPETLETDKVAIGSPDDIKSSIELNGKIELEGIYFDHNKATIKPESKSTLDIIVSYLSANKSGKFFVVGHTDNIGSLEHNMNLSDKRANAVVKALIKSGIKANQIAAKGVGPLSPNASNRTEDGKALNRRVELVED